MNCDFYCNIAECKLKGSARMDNKYQIYIDFDVPCATHKQK